MSIRPSNQPEPRLTLSPDDARVLDQIAENGFDESLLAGLSPPDRDRGDRLVGVMRRLDHYPVAAADTSLVDATMARIAQHDRRQQERFQLVGEEAQPRRWRPRWSDLFTVAALFLVGFGVLMPVVKRMREVSEQNACGANMASLGGAFSLFANDHDGILPASPDAPATWDVGRNSDHLVTLADGGYCEHGHLRCPGHDGIGHSYAYRMIAVPEAARLILLPKAPLVSDRNPMIDRAIQGKPVVNVLMPSNNHGGRGQQVLFGDVSVLWMTTPVVHIAGHPDDNFFLMRTAPDCEDLVRGAMPVDPDDHFLSQ